MLNQKTIFLFYYIRMVRKTRSKRMRLRHTVKKMRGGNNTLLIDLVDKGDKKEILELLESKPDINEKGVSGVTPLIAASTKSSNKDRSPEIVELLLEAGADVNIQSNDGLTALIGASIDGNDEIVKLLLDKSQNLNEKTKGMTALMAAAKGGHFEVVKSLLEAGADKEVKNKNGLIAYDIAKKYGHTKVVEILRDTVKLEVSNNNNNMGRKINLTRNSQPSSRYLIRATTPEKVRRNR
jgi:ankyrin repeat protein